jgi:hypothetical protein
MLHPVIVLFSFPGFAREVLGGVSVRSDQQCAEPGLRDRSERFYSDPKNHNIVVVSFPV